MTDLPAELLRWQGSTDAKLEEHERRLLAINGNIAKGADALTSLALEVGKLSTRVAVYAAIGGLVASTVCSIATGVTVYFLTQ